MFSNHYLKVVKKIDEGKSLNEICTSLNMSRKELYYIMQQLKTDGIDFNRRYYSNGVIYYEKIKKNRDCKEDPSISIITSPQEQFQRYLVISDTHVGNEKERLDLLERAYNFAIKNDIHIILICGDIIDGTYTKGIKERDIEEVYRQVERFIDIYPKDDSIITVGVLGDHDYSVFTGHGINIKDVIKMKRHDIAIGGYNNTTINVKNDNILLYHHINGGSVTEGFSPVILKGHSHTYQTKKRDDGVVDVLVPALSSVSDDHPSALLLDLSFDKGYIVGADLKQILFLDKDYIISNNSFEFKKRSSKDKIIKNEEPAVKERDLFDFIDEDGLDIDKEEEEKPKRKEKIKG